MKPIPAIIEQALTPAEERARAAFSALREAENQSAKAEKRAEAARGAVAMRRRELGLALVEVRKQWPERGPKARGWGEYLAREGIEQSTAWRMMDDVGYKAPVEDEISCIEDKTHEIPGPRLVPPAADDFDPAPSRPAARVRAGFDLRLGKWESTLANTGTVDVLVTDPPFSERTHASRVTRHDGHDPAGMTPDFAPWTQADVNAFVEQWSPRVRGWIVCLCDDIMIPWYRAAYVKVGRVDFQPVPCVIQGMSVRVRNDGPSSWTVYAMVGRPRGGGFDAWGTLPGAYVGGAQPGSERGRGKPLWLMDRIVHDYSRENDLVCDPLAGYGITLISAIDQKRRAIGAELDHGAYDEAYRRASIPRESD